MRKLLLCAVLMALLLSLLTTSISCTKAEPNISFSPSSLSFTGTQGETNLPIQAIGIWNSGGQTLNWSVTDDATWLNLSPTSGSSIGGSSNVVISVNISDLMAGNYTGLVTISAPEATNSPQIVPVTLGVLAPLPTPTTIPTPTPTPVPTPTPTPPIDLATMTVRLDELPVGWSQAAIQKSSALHTTDGVSVLFENEYSEETQRIALRNMVLLFTSEQWANRWFEDQLSVSDGSHFCSGEEVAVGDGGCFSEVRCQEQEVGCQCQLTFTKGLFYVELDYYGLPLSQFSTQERFDFLNSLAQKVAARIP
jgi:Viral BACON domain